jgi:nucleoside-diphosphate-sugar epimerase
MAQNIYFSRQEKTGVMIVGSGMVANALKNISGWDDDIIFASGVSNSGEQDEKEFVREIELVNSQLVKVNSNSTFVYFSTISVFDTTKADSPYIIHKLFLENLLRNSNAKVMIIRLPNLVGSSLNPNTLTNFFAESIRRKNSINVNSLALRHLIDVEELPAILNDIRLKYGKKNITINVGTDKPVSALQIVTMLEDVVGSKANATIYAQDIGTRKLVYQDRVKDIDYIWNLNTNYHIELFRKYYSE